MKQREVKVWGGVVRGRDSRRVVGPMAVNSPLHCVDNAHAPTSLLSCRFQTMASDTLVA
jgi:hypothetical protein